MISAEVDEAADEEIAAKDRGADDLAAVSREAWEEIIWGRKEADLPAATGRDGLDSARTLANRAAR